MSIGRPRISLRSIRLQGYKTMTLGRRNVMVQHNHMTRWEDADDDTGTLLPSAKLQTSLRHKASSQTAWSCRSARRDCAWALSRLFPRSGVGRRGDLSASPQRVVRAAKLADADGELQQLEPFGAEPDQSRQRRQPQGQVHGLAQRPDPSQ